MARTGKIATFEGSRENISKDTTKVIEKENLTSGINWSFTSDTGLNIYGEETELIIIESNMTKYNYILGADAPTEPTPEPEDPVDPDETQALIEMQQAFDTQFQIERDLLWTEIEKEYDKIKTTTVTFRRYTDIKHLRQKG